MNSNPSLQSYDWRKGRTLLGEVLDDARPAENLVIFNGLKITADEEKAWDDTYNRIGARRRTYMGQGVDDGAAQCMAYLNDPVMGFMVIAWSNRELVETVDNLDLKNKFHRQWLEDYASFAPIRGAISTKVLDGLVVTLDDFEPGNYSGIGNRFLREASSYIWHSFIQPPAQPLAPNMRIYLPYVILLDKEQAAADIKAFLDYVSEDGGFDKFYGKIREEIRHRSLGGN